MPHRSQLELIVTFAAAADRPWCWRSWQERTGTPVPPWSAAANTAMYPTLSQDKLDAIRSFVEGYRMSGSGERANYFKSVDGDLVQGRDALRAWLQEVWEDSWGLRSLCVRHCEARRLTIYGLAEENRVRHRAVSQQTSCRASSVLAC